jgi:hypothetical protein
MWEVRAAQRTFTELVHWVCEVAIPALEASPMHLSSEVYSSPDFRIVVITKWRSHPEHLKAPPEDLVARPPHTWDFTPVDR